MALRDAYAVGRGRGFWLKVKKSVAIVDGHGGGAYGLFVDDKLAPISPVKVSFAVGARTPTGSRTIGARVRGRKSNGCEVKPSFFGAPQAKKFLP